MTHSPHKILTATTPAEIMTCWPTIKELQPHLVESELVQRVQHMQKEAGLVLLYIQPKENEPAVAILTYRILHKFYDGKSLYIDDICTLSTAQGKGYGSALMDHIIQKAKDLNCDCVSLDSGYTRNNSHRFYLHKGFTLTCHHFTLRLKK